MKAKLKSSEGIHYGQIENVMELLLDYPYNTLEYQEAINALLRNLHKISPQDIWKLIEK